MPDFDLDRFLPYRLAVAASAVSREFADQYRARFDLSVAEWRVVAHLHHSGPVSVREITARVDLEKSRVSRAAARLEHAGYVSKVPDQNDGRLVVLTLTADGQAMMADLADLADHFQSHLSDRLPCDADTLMAALRALSPDPQEPRP